MSWTIAISHKSGIDWLNSQLFSFANPTIRFLWEKKTKTTQPKKLVWIMQLCRTWLAFCMIKKNTLEIATWGFRELNSWFDYFMISVLSDFFFQDHVLLLLLFLVSYLILVFLLGHNLQGKDDLSNKKRANFDDQDDQINVTSKPSYHKRHHKPSHRQQPILPGPSFVTSRHHSR